MVEYIRVWTPFASAWKLYIPAFVLGLLALVVGAVGPGRKQDRPLAVWAVTLSLAFASLGPAMTAPGRPAAFRAVCLQNVKQLTQAMLLYAEDSGGRLPPVERWCDLTAAYLGDWDSDGRAPGAADAFVCPEAVFLECGYACNAGLAGVILTTVTDRARTVTIFESDGAWNATGGVELLPLEPRHGWGQGDNYGFADGHARYFRRGAKELIWEPVVTRPLRETSGSVVLSLLNKWSGGWPSPAREFLDSGDKEAVDTQVANVVAVGVHEDMANPWDILGDGLRAKDYLDDDYYGAYFWRDDRGIRLIALEGPHFACDTLVLSTESDHPARLIGEDLSAYRTEAGVYLGCPAREAREKLGRPSRVDIDGEYGIGWYLQRPQEQRHPGMPLYRSGYAAAYALKQDRVVEIFLHYWDTIPVG